MKKYNIPNIFLVVIALFFLSGYFSRGCKIQKIKKEYSIQKVSVQKSVVQDKSRIFLLNQKMKLLNDSLIILQSQIDQYRMGIVKPDSTFSYWYYNYEVGNVIGYSIIKLSTQVFSLEEIQKTLHDFYKKKPTEFIRVGYFAPVSEFCYLQWQKSNYNN